MGINFNSIEQTNINRIPVSQSQKPVFGSLTFRGTSITDDKTSGLALNRDSNLSDISMMTPYGHMKFNEIGYA